MLTSQPGVVRDRELSTGVASAPMHVDCREAAAAGPDPIGRWSDFVAQPRRSGKSVKGFEPGTYLCVIDTIFRVSERLGAHSSPVWGRR